MATKIVAGGIILTVLAGSVPAAQAQEQAVRDSLRDASLRALAAAPVQTTADQPRVAEWSRVRSLADGEDVFITLAGQPMLKRRVLAADAAMVTVLNDTHPALDERVRRDLRELARKSPAALLQTLGPGKVRLDDLRISSAGVFLRDVRLGDVSMVIEIHARDSVAEIRLVDWSRPKRFWRYLLGWPGIVGFGAGTAAAVGMCEQVRHGCSDRTSAVAGTVGAAAMAVAARHHDKRIPDGVVYRRDP